LTANLATNKRKGITDLDPLGGTVLKLNSHGVKFTCVSTTLSTCAFGIPQYFEMIGVDNENVRWGIIGASYYYLLVADGDNTGQLLIQDCTAWTTSTTVTYFINPLVTSPKGTLVKRVYGHRVMPVVGGSYYASTNAGYKSGRYECKDCVCINWYANTVTTATTVRQTLENFRIENGRDTTSYAVAYVGINGIYKNNYYWGFGDATLTFGPVNVRNCINPTEISGNKFENNQVAMAFGANTNCLKCTDTDSEFDSNTIDLYVTAGILPDYYFDSPKTASFVTDETFVEEMVLGGKILFHNLNEVAGEDLAIFQLGKIRKTGTYLTDTTARNGFAMRFNATSLLDMFEFPFDVPTGNIQGLTMTVAVWCQIKDEDFWAGTYELPRLNVQYDGATTVYAQATQTAGSWQLLSVSFSPTTATGKITVTLSCQTDQADEYVYWDDVAVLYPAGYKLDLGGLDIWDNALPVLPPIATVMSAQDVWSVQTSALTGTGTICKKVNDIKKDTNLITGLL
jgi:hypothetical protein